YPDAARYLQPDGRQLLLSTWRERRDADQERALALPSGVRRGDRQAAGQRPRQRQGRGCDPAGAGAALKCVRQDSWQFDSLVRVGGGVWGGAWPVPTPPPTHPTVKQ